jgi:hypothetical protein
MRVIICGPRPPLAIRTNPEALDKWYAEHAHYVGEAVVQAMGRGIVLEITEEICGKAQGFDTLGECWARREHIPVKPFPANWKKFGLGAGKIRNCEMGDYAEALIALVATPPTRGTAHMVDYMKSLGKPVYEHRLPEGVA